MAKRLITLMAALLVLGFAVAGCGDDESGDSGSTETVTETVDEVVTDADTVTDTDTVTDETSTDADNGGAVVPEEAVDRCKEGIDDTSQLSGDAKDSLKDLCEKAGSGDAEKVRDAAVEVCKKTASAIPKGTPGRDRAIAACENAGR